VSCHGKEGSFLVSVVAGAIIGNLEILCLRKILRVCWSKLIQVKSSLTLVDSPFSLSPSPTYSLIRTRRQRIEIGQRI